MYKVLASFNYQHEYGASVQYTGMRCVMGGETQALLASMGGLIKQEPFQFSIVWDSSRFSRDELITLFADEVLVFHLEPINRSAFYTVTEHLDFYQIKKNTKQQPEQSISEAHADKKADQNPNMHVFLLAEAGKTSLIGENLCVLDVVGFAQKHNDQSLLALAAQAEKQHSICVVAPIAKLIAPEKNAKLAKISLVFSAKSTFLKFYFSSIYNNKNLKLRGVSSQSVASLDSGEVVFIPATEKLDDRPVKTFVSEKTIKLSDKAMYTLSLYEEINNVEYPLIDKLPQPKPDQFFHHHDATIGQVTVLEAFIN